MSPNYCVYHNNCWDGIVAAWIVNAIHPDAELIAMSYGDPIPALKGSVLFVDFSLPKKQTLDLCNNEDITRVTVIDHHASARDNLMSIVHQKFHFHFDITESGASLTFKVLIGSIDTKLTLLKLIDYTRDHDLWKFELPQSESIRAYMSSFPITIESCDQLLKDLNDIDKCASLGETVLRYQKLLVDQILDSCTRMVNVFGEDIPIANMPYRLASMAGNVLAKRYNGIGITYVDGSKDRSFSVRTIGQKSARSLAESFGGGGHENAAGFSKKLGWMFLSDEGMAK